MNPLRPLGKFVQKRRAPPGTIRVLIVDDEASMRRALRRVFEADRRFTVVAEARDGAEAAREAEAEQPSAVTLDLAMPNMDGLAAIPQIRRASPGTKIIVLSGVAAYDAAVRARQLGAHAVLSKLTSPRKLRAAVATAVTEEI